MTLDSPLCGPIACRSELSEVCHCCAPTFIDVQDTFIGELNIKSRGRPLRHLGDQLMELAIHFQAGEEPALLAPPEVDNPSIDEQDKLSVSIQTEIDPLVTVPDTFPEVRSRSTLDPPFTDARKGRRGQLLSGTHLSTWLTAWVRRGLVAAW